MDFAYLGCSGFYYNHWKGTFYPQNLPKTRWLQYYAERFNTLEINNTFYRLPSENLLLGWYKKTPANFRFFLKANRAITHTRKFHNTQDLTQRFYKLAYLLKEVAGGSVSTAVVCPQKPRVDRNHCLSS
jgi:uncharacterized protein YecE (DUF72 family)